MPGSLDAGREADQDAISSTVVTCPHCGAIAQFRRVSGQNIDDQPGRTIFSIHECTNCGGSISVELQLVGRNRFLIGRRYPLHSTVVTLENTPEPIRGAYGEALTCHSAGAVTAGALVGRRALQLITRDQGATRGDLWKEIEALNLPQGMADVAHAVRLIGNEAAHPDPLEWERVESQDLRDLLDFVSLLVDHLYETPAKVQRIKDRFAGSVGGTQ